MPVEPMPFAHPFFTIQPVESRQSHPEFGNRMREFARHNLEPIPELTEDPVWSLKDIVGTARAAQIEASGALRFHAVGDTGAGVFPFGRDGETRFGETKPENEEAQVAVARAMNQDLHPAQPGKSPAFFFLLGDVNYFNNTRPGYHEQFYVPYQEYGGKIIAIPGNHDGEVLAGRQRTTLKAFMENFCRPHPSVPPAAAQVLREMSAQPGVYWWLQSPFLDLVGLYSNVAEGPGHLRGGHAGEHQYEWFKTVLARISANRAAGTRKALVVAVHHPPITASLFNRHGSGHQASDEMRGDMDAAFAGARLWPDAVLAAHAHNYQRFTQFQSIGNQTKEIPYIVAGGGGHNTQTVIAGERQQQDNLQFEKSHRGRGYLLVTASATELKLVYHPVPSPDPDNADEVTVSL